ncbi:hypothetical protein C7H73_13530 [Pulveribacter suum]|uniref:Outer-membrane lipoprotein LolB n=1 Tax=Pulveribacter suum TaxID=2116657 RepID=A0A2P1NQ16_9BURK|nr:hypothetical protein C7H73_13530 [Pulveribacter suum]
MRAPERARLGLAVLAAAWLAGCAKPPRPAEGEDRADRWSGRLAVQVDDAAAQSFSAGFVLSGSAREGTLTLYNPLGNTLAELGWQPGRALLKTGGQLRESPSLHDLVRELTGTELPIEALFGWLHGQAVQASGWQADLSRLTDGRLVATRHTPAPQAVLRLVLER